MKKEYGLEDWKKLSPEVQWRTVNYWRKKALELLAESYGVKRRDDVLSGVCNEREGHHCDRNCDEPKCTCDD